jgi:Na+(H+)/acetate symporter ActP
MQFFILLIGVMVFVVYQFERPPVFFNPVAVERAKQGEHRRMFEAAEEAFAQAHEGQQRAYRQYLDAERRGDDNGVIEAAILIEQWKAAKTSARSSATEAIIMTDPQVDPADTNYVFLTFVLTHLPVGLIGLLFACVLAASLTSSSGELSALATASIVDLYRRHWRPHADDREALTASRWFMVAWGLYAIGFSQYAVRLGSLIEAVNIIGSLFYGTLLGIFLLAFYVTRVRGTAVFWSAFVGEAAVFACFLWTDISWLWYNVVGCVVVVVSALTLQAFTPEREAAR